MGESAYRIGREYMEQFVRIKQKARRADERYEEIVEDLKPSSRISGDRIQSGHISDPTFAGALRMATARSRRKKTFDAFNLACEEFEDYLNQIENRTHRAVILLYYFDGRGIAEIARSLQKRNGGTYDAGYISNVKRTALTELGKIIKESRE